MHHQVELIKRNWKEKKNYLLHEHALLNSEGIF